MHIANIEYMGKTKFRSYYDDLPDRKVEAPKNLFIKRISELCRVHPTTVRCWVYGKQRPDDLRKSIIAKEIGIPEQELFNEQ